MHSKLILASSSPRRQELVASLGLPYIIRVSGADESVSAALSPAEIVETLSVRKARAVCEELALQETGVIIGSDTIVVCEGEVMGKPADERDAFRMLSALQGRSHQVFSGVACLDAQSLASGLPRDARGGDMRESTVSRLGTTARFHTAAEGPDGGPALLVGHSVSTVTFKAMTAQEIEAYIRTKEPMDKAGAYGIQGIGAVFVERIEGDFYSIMGLPLHLLYRMLQEFGISPLQ